MNLLARSGHSQPLWHSGTTWGAQVPLMPGPHLIDAELVGPGVALRVRIVNSCITLVSHQD